MKFFSSSALLLVALPLGVGAASAQTQRSSVTSFDKTGNPVIQYTSPSDEDIARDGVRSSITSFDRNGNPVVQYTSPPLGTTAPDPNPGYPRFGYSYGTPVNGYYPYPTPSYGYNSPAYTVPLGSSIYGPGLANSLTVVPLSPGYAYPYPAPAYPPYYPPPAYPYGAPSYSYPAPAYNYGYPGSYGYGYGNGSVYSQSSGYGVTFGRGGLSVSVGGGNYSSSTRTTTTISGR